MLDKTTDQLVREEIQRQTLEDAARKLEQQLGSTAYQYAWKRAAQLIRGMKP